MNKIEAVLLEAVGACRHRIEEEGGVILYNAAEDSYRYEKLRNSNTGTPIAPVLWTADRYEYAEKVIPTFSKGWKHYASFHTHPQFIPYPSSIDYSELFPGFPINYIYSPATQEITQWNVTTNNSFEFKAIYDIFAEDDTGKDIALEGPKLSIKEKVLQPNNYNE